METIAEKLTYLAETKEEIRESLNKFGAGLTSSDTFRSYATSLDDFYESLPTVTGEGTELTLEETSSLPFKSLVPEGNTTQESTTGANLFNINDVYGSYPSSSNTSYEIEDNVLTITAIGTAGAQYLGYIISGLDSTESYTLSFKAKKVVLGSDGGPNIRIFMYGSNDGSSYTLLRSLGITPPTEGTEYSFNGTVTGYSYYRLFIYNNTSTPVTVGEQTQYYDIMFNAGSTASDWEEYTGGEASPNPSYPQTINNVTGDNTIVISNEDGTETQTLTFTLEEDQKLYAGDYLSDDGIHHVMGEVVLDGSDDENWQYPNTLTNTTRFSIELDNCKSNGHCVCDYFIEKIMYAVDTIGCDIISNRFYIRLDNTIATTISEAKNWLSENPITLQYELEEEVIESYTDTQQAEWEAIQEATSYSDTTIITTSGDGESMIVSAVAIQALS